MTPILLAASQPPDPIDLPPHLLSGDASRFGFAIASIAIQDGTALALPAPGVTALVGGNNVGKSTVLSQLWQWLPQESLVPPRVLGAVSLKREGTGADMVAWLRRQAHVQYPQSRAALVRNGVSTDIEYAAARWTAEQQPLLDLAAQVTHYATARNRHAWTDPAPRREDFTQPTTHPIQVFQLDKAARDELSRICLQTFGEPLTFDHLSGALQFRVGDPGVEAPRLDEISVDYSNALGRLRPLNQQGDGMVFMLGTLIPLVAATYPVVLIDEPEAFLHPPQAHLMGQALATLAAQQGIQIILATHDSNILRGLLEPASADVSIIRLTRQGNLTTAQQVHAEDVREIGADPVLRYTNILDGLFHQLVVLAENERDCTFYQAAVDYAATQALLPVSPQDILFVPTSGKGNMAGVARILRNTGVRVVATPDLDILSNVGELKKLVDALGEEWDSEWQQLYDRAVSQFRNPKKGRLNRDIATIITAILHEDPDEAYDAERRARIDAELDVQSPWSALKREGKSAMSSDRRARDELLRRLDALGLITVEVGELEAFDRDAPQGKNKWLGAALTNGAHKRPAAQGHVARLVNISLLPAEPDT